MPPAPLLDVSLPTTTATNVAEALTLRQPGLYPITVQLVDGDNVVAEDHTFIERLPVDPSTAPPMNVALVAAIDDPGPTPTANELAVGPPTSRRPRRLDDRGRGARDRVHPAAARRRAWPTTIRSCPPSCVRRWPATRCSSLPSDRLDPSSAVAIGKAETFTRRLRDGEDALGAALPGIAATRSGWLVTSPVSTDAQRSCSATWASTC